MSLLENIIIKSLDFRDSQTKVLILSLQINSCVIDLDRLAIFVLQLPGEKWMIEHTHIQFYSLLNPSRKTRKGFFFFTEMNPKRWWKTEEEK